jgi:hypothetical protein
MSTAPNDRPSGPRSGRSSSGAGGGAAQHTGTPPRATWSRVAALLARSGIHRIALIGASPKAWQTVRNELERHAIRVEGVDGQCHHTQRDARAVAARADLIVVCVSGPIAHRVSRHYRSEARAVWVCARGGVSIAEEIEEWLLRHEAPITPSGTAA